MPYVPVPGTRIYYAETGPSTGRPLLLLHAALQTGESMEPLRAVLGPMGFRMVSPDQRGHGRSGNPVGGLSVPRLADDMVALMAELGLERPVVVGYSLGGIVGIELARRGLLSGLVVMASRIHPAPAGHKAFDPEDIRRRSPGWVKHLVASHVEMPWAELAVAVGGMLERWSGFSVGELARVDCGVLVVQGDRDLMVPLGDGEELAAAVPGGVLRVVPRAGHAELLYRADALDAVRAFVVSAPG